MTTFTKSARALRRNNPLLSLVIAGHLLRQKALGHFITRVDVPADPANGLEENAAILAGPRQITVKLGQATAVPWQLLPRETLDAVLGALYAQILADGAALPELLVPLAGVHPEDARASKALTRRLRGALGLRSVLDLSASWVDAPGPTHGWPSGTRPTLHRDDMHRMRRAEDRWHLWDLRRWNPGGLGTEENPAWWAEDIRTAVLVSATLSDFTGHPCPGLLPWDKGSRVKRRSQNEVYLGQIQEQVSRQLGDPSGAAFIARARQALAWTLCPAARGFDAAAVDSAVQGARSAQVLLARLAPDVSARTLQRVAGVFETQLAEGNSMHEGGLGLTLRAAGEGRARREAWLLGAAADMTAASTLGTEAAAAQDLGTLIPTLRGAGDDSAFGERELVHATSEIRDVFWSLCELSRDGTLPLTGLDAILSSSGHLRIGARARPRQEEPELDDGQLKLIPGLPQVYAALAGYNDIRAATAAWLRAEACSEVGVSTEALDEKLSGQPPFHLTPENLALERCLSWPGGAWRVQLARHPLDLQSDGQALSHCLGWGGYAHAVSEGSALIVRILDNGERRALRGSPGDRWLAFQCLQSNLPLKLVERQAGKSFRPGDRATAQSARTRRRCWASGPPPWASWAATRRFPPGKNSPANVSRASRSRHSPMGRQMTPSPHPSTTNAFSSPSARMPGGALSCGPRRPGVFTPRPWDESPR